MTRLNIMLLVFMSLALLVMSSCDKDSSSSSTIPSMDFGVVAGTVYSPGRAVLPGVIVSIGDQSTVTGQNGDFILSGIAPGPTVQVDFEMTGKISTQKIVSVEKDRTSRISATLFGARVATYDGMSSISIDETISLEIPQQAFVTPDGSPFQGTVRSEIRYFDPTQPECLDAFPGGFSGVQTDGNITMFESYGFFSASFFDAVDTEIELQLAENKQVEISAPIPYALLADAPDTMPLWFYDEEAGLWYEEGMATKEGNSYVGSVSHFSYWNFDYPVEIDSQATLTGKVVTGDTEEGVSGAQVVATGVSYSGYTNAYTDDQGMFSITVKASAQVKLQAFSGTSISFFTPTINSPAGGATSEVDDIIIQDQSFTIMGRVVDTAGDPITGHGNLRQLNTPENEYGMHQWLTFEEDGSFSANCMSIGSLTYFDVLFSTEGRSSLFSSPIAFAVPQPGHIWDFGDITLRPGGELTGRIKDNNGNFMADIWFSIGPEEAEGEGDMYFSSTDENGNFTISGPPNTRVSNVKVQYWSEEQTRYQSSSFNLNFPSSGQSESLGTITISPVDE